MCQGVSPNEGDPKKKKQATEASGRLAALKAFISANRDEQPLSIPPADYRLRGHFSLVILRTQCPLYFVKTEPLTVSQATLQSSLATEFLENEGNQDVLCVGAMDGAVVWPRSRCERPWFQYPKPQKKENDYVQFIENVPEYKQKEHTLK